MINNKLLYNTYKETSVYSEPDENSEVLFVLQPKSSVLIDRETSTEGWWHIFTPMGADGYIQMKHKKGQQDE